MLPHSVFRAFEVRTTDIAVGRDFHAAVRTLRVPSGVLIRGIAAGVPEQHPPSGIWLIIVVLIVVASVLTSVLRIVRKRRASRPELPDELPR